MDIEKLIEDLRGLLKQYGEKIPYGELVGAPWPYSRAGDLVWQDPEPYFIEHAATALSTLQAENEELRAELEYEKEHANAYYEECGQWEVENAQLKEKVEALQRERDSIEQDFRAFAKQWWEQDSGFPCCWCKFKKSEKCEWKSKHKGQICAGGAFEWRGQKED